MPKSKKSKKQKSLDLVKGFKDILPEDQFYWDFVREKFIAISHAYGFERIDLPMLEDSKLFVRGVGVGTDIVSKEMFTFETLGKEKVSMRPEGTAGVVRAYIEHGMLNKRKPVKLFYMGEMFRYDKPQAGRYRQFHQFGLEIFGEDDPIIDAQLIYMCYQMYQDLKIDVDIQINSIGCKNCRAKYEKALKIYLKKNKSKLCKECNYRYTKNILRILDCKEKKCHEIVEEAPQIVDFLCEDCNKHFVKVLEYLDDIEVPYTLNTTIVRGLDYYNRTTFEIFPKAKHESQSALGGGGRYDGLVKELGGVSTPAIGLALGMERTINILRERENEELERVRTHDIFVAQLGDTAKKRVLTLFEELRQNGFDVCENISKTALKQQLEDANRLKAKMTLIIGQKEILDNTVLIRDMESGNQEIVPDSKIVSVLARRLNSLNLNKKK
ncbi:MAG: histidine--tRNA ligase [Patescibacteria group bacterium]|nr:histidine--tRNA ligase [Patescibacteria group bacterium]MDD4304112.1 histidine--tRNA ligase [Patescibacteria group bacterium]MDD4694989.1 histidine--tRNA ligase [Patescibacteria group bacterium]